MSTPEQFEDGTILKEHELPNGEQLTLIYNAGEFIVDSWAADGESRWSKSFPTQDAALTEYNRFAN